jgi:beta-lactamase superfamily II metal-dependent hydrolase
MHCGDGQWLSVDSAREGGRCWALSYLSGLRINPAAAVRLLVCTHWHSDHVRGLTELVAACPRAQFVCSSALRADEFKELLARYRRVEALGKIQGPIGELRGVFEILAARRQEKKTSRWAPVLAKAHLGLDAFNAAGIPIRVEALSPSADDVITALEAFASYFVPPDETTTGLSPIDQNHASVVIHVQAGSDTVLLGADLETTKSAGRGWNAVVASTIRPQSQAGGFKIPHHGSSNAHSDQVWRHMVRPGAYAVVTPYLSSGLPRSSDIERLKAQNAVILATRLPRTVPVRRRPEVERTTREAAPDLTAYRVDQPGVVRLRKLIGGTGWRQELFGAAARV